MDTDELRAWVRGLIDELIVQFGPIAIASATALALRMLIEKISEAVM